MITAISQNPWLMVLVIFVVNIVYVSFLTMRTISTLKGYRYTAAAFSILETFVYVIGLGLVLENLDQFQNVVAYALGFGAGILVGLKIEEKLALGYLVVNVITSQKDKDLPTNIRDLGYGVTHGYQYGRDGERTTMQILTPRKYERKLIDTIKELDEKAFIITHEPKNINGGFWTKGVKRKRLKNYQPENVEEVLEEISEAREMEDERNAEKEKV
ncbi:DUF2179 domain-containing protein [Salinicoccus sp. ID82-1]|uniref:DUF2179 domain-containing protein n=1 Tax=Salinicoccus sp. ID82-1 TaxID=2820269 RepID=UPI002103D29E|nr:DUF2179 domain-containing protein [Salinicoccus sp. ID82-1]